MRLTITRHGRRGFHILHDHSFDGVFIDTQKEHVAQSVEDLLDYVANAVNFVERRIDAAEYQRPAHKNWRERIEADAAPAA